MKSNLKKFQFIQVNEQKVNMKYDGVEDKKSRPYLVIKTNISQGYFLATPLTSVCSSFLTHKKKRHYWIEFNLYKNSYIKLDHIIIFQNKEININITPTNKFLDPYLRKKAKKLLKELIDS